MLAAEGNFCGTICYGGSGDFGTIFRVNPTGTLITVYSFSNTTDGACPNGQIQASERNFFGTTSGTVAGRAPVVNGTVFQITPAGQPRGRQPDAELRQFTGRAVALTPLVTFNGTNGQTPNGSTSTSPLVLSSDGNFYGTTSAGGSSGFGTIFRMTPTGTLTTLYNFLNLTDGATPGGLGARSPRLSCETRIQ